MDSRHLVIPGLSTPQLEKVTLSGNRISSLGDILYLLDSPDTEIDLSANLITYLLGKSTLEINYSFIANHEKMFII